MTTQRIDRPDNGTMDAALAWHAALQNEGAGLDRFEAFAAWLESDPSHAHAFERVEAMHSLLDENSRLLFELLPPEPPPAIPVWRSGARWLPWAGGGVIAGLAALVAVFAWWPGPAPAQWNAAFEALAGQSRSVTLADGSRVDLSAGSRISVHFDGAARLLTLDRGEVEITVGHDPRKLTLRAADLQIRDTGTVFDVSLQPSRVTVTVVSGAVAVSSGGQDPAGPVSLSAGQQFVRDRRAGQNHVVAVDPQAALSWQKGFMTYQDVALSDIVADLDRNFAAHVTVADPAVAERRFSGVLRVDTMDATLNRLSALLNLSIVRRGDAVELVGSGPHP